jgi:chromosome partitioning protein
MKVVSLVQQKGGSGKSVLCRHLAVAGEQAGHKTVIIDSDAQGTLRDWAEDRLKLHKLALPEVVVELSPNRKHLQAALDRIAGNGAEIAFIDTPGSLDSPFAANAMAAADIVLVPLRPTPEDLKAFWPVEERVVEARKPFHTVLNQCPNTGKKLMRWIHERLARNKVPLCPIEIHTKTLIPWSFKQGLTSLEATDLTETDQKTVDEFRELFTWTRREINLQPKQQQEVRDGRTAGDRRSTGAQQTGA